MVMTTLGGAQAQISGLAWLPREEALLLMQGPSDDQDAASFCGGALPVLSPPGAHNVSGSAFALAADKHSCHKSAEAHSSKMAQLL